MIMAIFYHYSQYLSQCLCNSLSIDGPTIDYITHLRVWLRTRWTVEIKLVARYSWPYGLLFQHILEFIICMSIALLKIVIKITRIIYFQLQIQNIVRWGLT